MSLLSTAALNAAIPCLFASPAAVLAVRILSGLVQAPAGPCYTQLVSDWTAEAERTRAACWGGLLGSTIGQASSGLCEGLLAHFKRAGDERLGLSLTFWLWSGPAPLCALVLLLLVPERRSAAGRAPTDADGANGAAPRGSIPWPLFFTSPPLLALYGTNIASNSLGYLISNELPSFLDACHATDVQKQVVASFVRQPTRRRRPTPLTPPHPTPPQLGTTLPFLTSGIVQFLIPGPADLLIRRGADITKIRRGFQAVGLLAAGALMVVASLTHSAAATLALMTAGITIQNSFTSAGYGPCYMELVPQFAYAYTVVGDAASTVPGILSPLAVDALTRLLGPRAGFSAAFGIFGLGLGVPSIVAFVLLYDSRRIAEMRARLERAVGADEVVAPRCIAE